MNTIQRITKNTIVSLFGKIASCVLNFLFVMYTVRYLGAKGFGVLSFALAFTGIIGVFADLGLSMVTAREVARDKSLAGKYIGNITAIKAVSVLIVYGVIVLAINLLGYPKQTIEIVYLIALSMVFNTFSQTFYSIFQAYEKLEYQSLGQILNSVLMLVGGLFAISQGFSSVGFAFIYFIVSAIVLGYSAVVCVWKFTNIKMEIDTSFWKSTIKVAWVFAIGNFFASIYSMIDKVMLSVMKGDVEVGYYSAAYVFINVLSFIPAAFVASIFPVMSNYFNTSESSLNKMYACGVKYMLTLAFPITAGTILLSKKIICMIYGTAFLASAQPLNILILSGMLIFVEVVMSYMLFSMNKEKITLFNAGVGAILNVALNILLIPKMSFTGAAIATVASDIYFFISSAYFISKYGYKLNFPRIVIRPLLASIIMGCFVYYLNSLNLFALVPLSAVLYFVVLYMVGGFGKEDVFFFKQLIKTNY